MSVSYKENSDGIDCDFEWCMQCFLWDENQTERQVAGSGWIDGLHIMVQGGKFRHVHDIVYIVAVITHKKLKTCTLQ